MVQRTKENECGSLKKHDTLAKYQMTKRTLTPLTRQETLAYTKHWIAQL